MARSAALDPTSVPFFPGATRGGDESGVGLVFANQPPKDHDQKSISSLSISPSEYRSVTSSPSSSTGRREFPLARSPEPSDAPQNSAFIRRTDSPGQYGRESRIQREASMTAAFAAHTPEILALEKAPSPTAIGAGTQTPGSIIHPLQQKQEKAVAHPVNISFSGASSQFSGFNSASPVSSLDSGSHFSPSFDGQPTSFETQLKASPLIRDILDRLVRYEITAREIQYDLADVQRKVNLLLERAFVANTQPEFKDPFASSNGLPSQPNAPRPSIGNIAPNQVPPVDDVSTISQRLNTLTTSVGQLLALQTQQLQANTELRNNSVFSTNGPQSDIAPNQPLPPAVSNLGHTLPNRQDMRPSSRVANLPLRTWSAGNLDLPVRANETSALRQDSLVRDKRRSVVGLRRESAGMSEIQADGASREGGPIITKWDQLPLAPDLLRSLTKFGLGPPNKIQQRALPFLLRGADIIAQAPPTQERIAAYVIPALQIALSTLASRLANRGPVVIMVSTTVDQATQAQRMIRDLGGPIGIRSALGVGAVNPTSDLTQELRALHQSVPHIICGTPQKLHAFFTLPGGLVGSEVRFLVLDEVDQLIARNLHDFVLSIVKLLPPTRSRQPSSGTSSSSSLAPGFEVNSNAASAFQGPVRRFSTAIPSPSLESSSGAVERQTALFSNTVPQDVLNLASAIHLREPVRVLVRRDGNASHPDNTQSTRGLRQYYLYLAFTTGSGRSDPGALNAGGGGLGIIGSGRGASNPESAQAREWKLDALADIFDDADVQQAIVHVGGTTALDAVVYKLASRGIEAVPLHGDMSAANKLAALNKFRNSNPVLRQPTATKVLVLYDVPVKTPDISHVPLVVNYDLPKAVEEYAHRVAPAIASNYARAGVVINFVTATGGDVEMLRSIECFYKIKCPEVPMSLRDIL